MSKPRSSDPSGEMKALTRRRIRLVWEMALLGGHLEDDDARLVQAMREHPEYADLWGRLDELSDEQIERDGTNPILHVHIHQLIENQIAGGEPKEVGQTVEELMRRGLSRHEAVHRVGAVVSGEIWRILKDNRPFDGQGVARQLRRLVEKMGTPRRYAKRR